MKHALKQALHPLLLFLRFKNSLSTVPSCHVTRLPWVGPPRSLSTPSKSGVSTASPSSLSCSTVIVRLPSLLSSSCRIKISHATALSSSGALSAVYRISPSVWLSTRSRAQLYIARWRWSSCHRTGRPLVKIARRVDGLKSNSRAR